MGITNGNNPKTNAIDFNSMKIITILHVYIVCEHFVYKIVD